MDDVGGFSGYGMFLGRMPFCLWGRKRANTIPRMEELSRAIYPTWGDITAHKRW